MARVKAYISAICLSSCRSRIAMGQVWALRSAFPLSKRFTSIKSRTDLLLLLLIDTPRSPENGILVVDPVPFWIHTHPQEINFQSWLDATPIKTYALQHRGHCHWHKHYSPLLTIPILTHTRGGRLTMLQSVF